MAKEFITAIWCDLCLERNGEQVEATEYGPLSLPGLKGEQSLDLCPPHHVEVLMPLLEALREHGKASSAKAQKSREATRRSGSRSIGEHRCRVPGCTGYNGARYSSADNLRSHLKRAHDLTLTDYQEQYGALDAAPTNLPAQPSLLDTPDEVCGIDGCQKVYPRSQYKRPEQALAVHRQRRHGVSSKRKREADQSAA